MVRPQLLWFAIIVLLQLAVTLGLRSSPEIALQYWYLLSAPMLLAAARFGVRGAAATSIVNVAVLTVIFFVFGRSVVEATGFLEGLIQASRSPEEASSLALRLADLRAADPTTAFGRALTGTVLTITGAMMLGAAVDHGNRITGTLQQVYAQLARYCHPRIVQAIVNQQGQGELDIISVRKEITILFADLRGFTALAERLEPEEIARLLNEFFTAMTEEIVREGGTLDKYIGDEVMAFFGDPDWRPDHPVHAIRAALAMQQRMRLLHDAWRAQGRETVGMGIGVATGHATVGVTGSPSLMQYTALGSTVNIASRLSDLAAAGQVLTTRKTFWRVREVMAGVNRGPITVKGFAQPVEIVEILGTRLPGRQAAPTVSPRVAEIVSRVVEDPALRARLLTTRPSQIGESEDSLNEDELALARQVAVLTGYPLLQSVPAGEIATLMAQGRVEEYEEGALVVRQGETHGKFYIIMQGDVIITALNEQGWERHLASLARGDHFGEVALLFDTPRTATVRAGSPSRLLALDQEDFYTVLSHAPTLRERIETAARSRMATPATARSASKMKVEVR